MKRLVILFAAGVAALIVAAFAIGHPVAWVQAGLIMANSTKRWSFSDSVGALAGLLMKCTTATTTMIALWFFLDSSSRVQAR